MRLFTLPLREGAEQMPHGGTLRSGGVGATTPSRISAALRLLADPPHKGREGIPLRRREPRDQRVALGRIGETDMGDRVLGAPCPPLDHQAGRAGLDVECSRNVSVGGDGADAVLGGTPWHAGDQPRPRRDGKKFLVGSLGHSGQIDQPLFVRKRPLAGEMPAFQRQHRPAELSSSKARSSALLRLLCRATLS